MPRFLVEGYALYTGRDKVKYHVEAVDEDEALAMAEELADDDFYDCIENGAEVEKLQDL